MSRSILDSDVFASEKLLKIWIWCLCKANFKEKSIPLQTGRGQQIIKVKRGQFLFGRFKAENELFISGSTIYKCLKRLEKLKQIEINSNSQYSIITLCNYDSYQDPSNYKVTRKGQVKDKERTSKGQVSNTTNNDNNVNTLKNDNNKKTADSSAFFKDIFLQYVDKDYYWRAKDG
ncbi:MAG: hypothetical protein ACE5H1_09895, partial [Thermodesulfobacteriota bacterium]